MNLITIEVGQTRLETPNAHLARQVLEHAAGISPALEFAELVAGAPVPPAIGQYWHGQGGVYAGLVRGEDGHPDYHLVVPTDASATAKEVAWGAAGESEDGAGYARDGLANTRALCDSEHDHPAAQWAASLEIEGHRDFYLPSRFELALCYANVRELFEERWHWSSTQCSPNHAWLRGFDAGTQLSARKDNAYRARAVRRVVNP
ncbi:Lcl C-terminal domain-containing protein [Metapseudomonas furukawaii]